MIEMVRALVANVLGKKPSEIGLDDDFDDLGLDSLDLIDLVLRFEEATGKKVPDADLIRMTSVRAAASYLEAA